jgi:hypothetical protein
MDMSDLNQPVTIDPQGRPVWGAEEIGKSSIAAKLKLFSGEQVDRSSAALTTDAV